jgi:hypothetical protein
MVGAGFVATTCVRKVRLPARCAARASKPSVSSPIKLRIFIPFDLKSALEALFERSVDLVELSALPDTRLKRSIARAKVPVYAATA